MTTPEQPQAPAGDTTVETTTVPVELPAKTETTVEVPTSE